jgi:oxysterol-binding protein-related protein 3/6/7
MSTAKSPDRKKPSSFMRNLMMGTKYLEHSGQMVIENKTTGARCVLEFKEAGYWSPANVVEGKVFTSQGDAATAIEGKWDEQLAQKLDDSHLRVLWRISPFPKHCREYYGFTSFAITLNEITPDLEGKLPPTDSRFRPDVRALEEGDLDRAEEEKRRVEEAQRERRRQGKNAEPRWFRQVGSDDWQYVGGYWEERAQGWKTKEPLW